MTHYPADDSFGDHPNPPADAPALKWPVLARLPYIGEPRSQQSDQIGGYREPHAKSSRGREEPLPPSLRMAETPASSRSHLDPSHSTRSTLQAPDSIDAVELAEVTSEPAKRIHRIDAGVPRSSVMPMTASRAPWPNPVSETLASRVFQWHAMLAPHAGVAMTFFLALSAGVLYWATIGSPRATALSGKSPEAPMWTTESLHAPATAPNAWQAPMVNDGVAEFSWSRSADAGSEVEAGAPVEESCGILATTESLAAELATADPNVSRVEAPQADASAIGTLTPNPGEDAPAEGEWTPVAIDSAEPIAGAPLSITYPTTPFAAFDFGLASQPAATVGQTAPTSQGIVAEVTVEGTTPPTSTR